MSYWILFGVIGFLFLILIMNNIVFNEMMECNDNLDKEQGEAYPEWRECMDEKDMTWAVEIAEKQAELKGKKIK